MLVAFKQWLALPEGQAAFQELQGQGLSQEQMRSTLLQRFMTGGTGSEQEE